MENMAGIAATKLVALLRFLEGEPSRVRRKRMPQLVRVLGGVAARRGELARFAMALVSAPRPLDPRLMPDKLLPALGEFAAEMPLHPVGEP